MKKAAIVLSGCGVYDGSEIHEAVIALMCLQSRNFEVDFYAPNISQYHTVNHLNGKEETPSRSVLEESARIARGAISDLSEFSAEKYDVLAFPGGFGAAKNLSTFAFDGKNCEVNKDVERAIKSALRTGSAIVFMCISPVIAAKVIGSGVVLTIGRDPATASAIESMGAKHVDKSAGDFARDEKFNVWTTPAYMLASSAAEVFAGASKMFDDIVNFLNAR